MNAVSTLASLEVGQSAYVEQVTGEGAMCRRLMDLGLIPGTRVTCVARAPRGGPAAYLIRGAVIALRGRDARGVAARPAPAGACPRALPA